MKALNILFFVAVLTSITTVVKAMNKEDAESINTLLKMGESAVAANNLGLAEIAYSNALVIANKYQGFLREHTSQLLQEVQQRKAALQAQTCPMPQQRGKRKFEEPTIENPEEYELHAAKRYLLPGDE